MTAASEEPEFDRVDEDSISGDSFSAPATCEEADASDVAAEPQPPPHPWRFWLAWGAILLGAAMFGRSWWRSQQHSIAVDETNQGMQLVLKGQYQEGLALLTDAVSRDPSLAVAWANRAAAHIGLKQFDAARGDCERALALEPDNFIALTNLGSVLQESGDLAGAQEKFSRAIACNPASGVAQLNLATIALTSGQNDAAIAGASEALRYLTEAKRRSLAYEVRGRAYLASENYALALSDFSEASRIFPDRPEYQLQIAASYDGSGNLDEAENHLTNAIHLAEGKSPYYEQRAKLRFRLKKYVEAVDDCTRALESDPKVAGAFMIRAAARIELGQLEEATADCDAAIAIEPAFPGAWLSRGDAWRKRGEPARAVDDYSEAIRLYPGMMVAWFGRGVARSQMRDFEEAIADYSKAIELDPDFAAAWYNRSIAHEALGKTKEARSDRQKALELDPNIGSVGRTEAT